MEGESGSMRTKRALEDGAPSGKKQEEQSEEQPEQQQEVKQAKRRRRSSDSTKESVPDLSTVLKRLQVQIKLSKELEKGLWSIKDISESKTTAILNNIPSAKLQSENVVHRFVEVKALAKELEIDKLLGLGNTEGRQQAKYFVTGLPGAGKSFLIQEIVARLRKTEEAKVIFLQHLKAPLGEELLHGLVHAFPGDDYMSRKCLDACGGDDENKVQMDKVRALYADFPGYCFARSKQAFLVLDDLPLFYDTSSGLGDFLKSILQLEAWNKWVTTIFVGTATTPIADAFLGDTITIKPSVVVASAKAMLKRLDVQVNQMQLQQVFTETGFVPGQLDELSEYIKGEEDDFENGLQKFREQQKAAFTRDVEEYLQLLESRGGTKEFAQAVLLMKLKLPVSARMDYAVFPKLMYVNRKKVEVITAMSELAHKVLVDAVAKRELEKPAAQALISKVLDKRANYSEEVRATVAKLLVTSVIAENKELLVNSIYEPGKEKGPKKTFHFKDLAVRRVEDVQAIDESGNFLLVSAYDLDTVAILMDDEDDKATFGLTALDVCLDLKKASTRFYSTQASPWAKALDLDDKCVRHLWIVPSTKGLNTKSDMWSKKDKKWGEKPRHLFVSFEELVKANEEHLDQLKFVK